MKAPPAIEHQSVPGEIEPQINQRREYRYCNFDDIHECQDHGVGHGEIYSQQHEGNQWRQNLQENNPVKSECQPPRLLIDRYRFIHDLLLFDPGAVAPNRAEHDQISPERYYDQEQVKQQQRPPWQKRGLICRRYIWRLHQAPANAVSAGRKFLRELMLQIEG